jgi:hypothetical protein
MKTLISVFNLTHSGSRNIYDSLMPILVETDNILIIDKSHKVPENYKSKIYRFNYEKSSHKWLKKHLIEQFFIPIICRINNIKKIILFGNLPSLCLWIPQVVFFHNLLYIEKFEKSLSQIINQLIFSFLINIKSPVILVQTQYVKKRVTEIFGNIQIEILKTSISYPILTTLPIFEVSPKQINVIYPSFFYPHKNHSFLIKNISIFEKLDIHLWLTCKPISCAIFSPNLHYLGEHSSDVIKSHYSFFSGIFNISDFESLGMYLLEAVSYKIPVISCDKEYVSSAIEGFYSFKHLCTESLEVTLGEFKRDHINGKLIYPNSNLIDDPKKIVVELLR